MKLSVNIDHIATVRQARLAQEPDPVHAAVQAELAGADGITLHLRQDRRHVQERDLELITSLMRVPVNLEMALSMEMVKLALKYKPSTCTLVPESSDEVTTTGGLDLILCGQKARETAENLKSAGIRMSVFIDPDPEQVKACHRLDFSLIEINTGPFAESFPRGAWKKELDRIAKTTQLARKLGLTVHAGHGLTYQNVQYIKNISDIEELNIGHSLIANAFFLGLPEAVKRMKELIRR